MAARDPVALLVAVAAVWGLVAGGCGSTAVTEETLASRIAASRPSWENYQEDIKAQIGAGPAAEWNGKIGRVSWNSGSPMATFELSGPWARRVAMPILMRNPEGAVQQSGWNVVVVPGGVMYGFTPNVDSKATPPAWIELKFPGGQQRIVFSSTGDWQPATDK